MKRGERGEREGGRERGRRERKRGVIVGVVDVDDVVVVIVVTKAQLVTVLSSNCFLDNLSVMFNLKNYLQRSTQYFDTHGRKRTVLLLLLLLLLLVLLLMWVLAGSSFSQLDINNTVSTIAPISMSFTTDSFMNT